jgi:CRISPR-associated protein Csm1
MDERIWKAALAGLLHDIGKFAQRAGEGRYEAFDANTRQEVHYDHALRSYWFVQQYISTSLRNEGRLSGVAYHHRPKSIQDYWIQLADWLSSAEREQDEDQRIPRMQSVFSSLSGYQNKMYLPLTRLNPGERSHLFPESLIDNEWKEQAQKSYEALWKEFESELHTYKIAEEANLEICLELLYALLQEFTWCIPSSFWHSVPDVSLFDHLRTTASIAACLAADQRSIDWCQHAREKDETICYLVGADLSNLQGFIYNLASSGAAKSLRARSFYVQMISDALAHYILDQLNLPITNLVYVGGGGFQLLTPVSSLEKLPQIAQDLAGRLLEVHQGGLGFTLQWVEVKYSGFEKFNLVRDELGKRINYAKRQPFASATAQILAQVVGQPITQGGDPTRYCSVTGEDGETIRKDADGDFKSLFVLSLEELGGHLPKATHIVTYKVKPAPPARATGWQSALHVFGMDAQLIQGKPPKVASGSDDNWKRIWRLTPIPDPQEDQWLKPFQKSRFVVSYRLFARLTPLDENGNPLTFDDLARPRRGNFKRWGVLRMDVDNLGLLFQKGFGEKASLSRTASLSFALRIFFEGWLPMLATPQPDNKAFKDDLRPYVYLQYSGGDDLFIVGAWDVLPELAMRIHNSFKDYTAGNPSVTLSGGMSMVDKGFPIYQAAQQAGEAEDQAKSFHRADGREKDAFTFLGQSLDWETLELVAAQAYHLAEGIERHRLPRSLLQTLLGLNTQIQQARRRGVKPLFGRWTWMAAYQLTRHAMDVKDPDEKHYVEELRNQYLFPNPETEALGLAARWAQYLTRGG